ncbi:insulinase family protein [Candidatus Woesearchaeota archaeon]|nr:insulinase family protein [Candidatus Woesearchaeota archaeon]
MDMQLTSLHGLADGVNMLTLPNGLRVAWERTPTETVAAMLRTRFGSGHERAGQEGWAHLLEHIIMSGGSRRFPREESAAVRRKLGTYNMQTGWNDTTFTADFLAERTPLFLEFLSDLAFHPLLREQDLVTERTVAEREIAESISQPGFQDYSEFTRACFGEGQYTYAKLGRPETLALASVGDMRSLHARGYGASNMDLILVGGLPEGIEDLVRASFEHAPAGEPTPAPFQSAAPIRDVTTLVRPAPERANGDEETSAEFYLALSAPPSWHQDSVSINMLAYLLGGDPDSLLFRKVREEKGLAYRIQAVYDGTDDGLAQVQAFVPPSRWEEVLSAVFDEFQNLKARPIDEDEFHAFKDILRYSMAKSSERNESRLQRVRHMLDGELALETMAEVMEEMTPLDLQDAARNYLSTEDYVLLVRDPSVR